MFFIFPPRFWSAAALYSSRALFSYSLNLAKINIRAALARSPLQLFPVLGSSFAAPVYPLTMRRINFYSDAYRNLNYLLTVCSKFTSTSTFKPTPLPPPRSASCTRLRDRKLLLMILVSSHQFFGLFNRRRGHSRPPRMVVRKSKNSALEGGSNGFR
jgi:hypothetical protein